MIYDLPSFSPPLSSPQCSPVCHYYLFIMPLGSHFVKFKDIVWVVKSYRHQAVDLYCLVTWHKRVKKQMEVVMEMTVWLDVSEDKRRSRKSGSSHFSEARKRGRTMIYHLTSQFSRGGKREVNLGSVSTGTASIHSSIGKFGWLADSWLVNWFTYVRCAFMKIISISLLTAKMASFFQFHLWCKLFG